MDTKVILRSKRILRVTERGSFAFSLDESEWIDWRRLRFAIDRRSFRSFVVSAPAFRADVRGLHDPMGYILAERLQAAPAGVNIPVPVHMFLPQPPPMPPYYGGQAAPGHAQQHGE